MFAPDQRLTLDSNRAVWREIGDEVVVLDTATATYMSLNATGRALWAKLDEGATPAELTAELVSTYGLPASQAASDVEDFLSALEGLSLLSSGG
jgi:hypothetical protein